MSYREKTHLASLVIASLILMLGWWACSHRKVEINNTNDQNVKKALLELGEAKLRLVSRFGQPREFFIFGNRYLIREAGFDPVWKNDRYTLRDLETGKEFAPFYTNEEINPRSKGTTDEDPYVREAILQADTTTSHMPDGVFVSIYEHQLNGFHLVLRRRTFFGSKGELLYVKHIRKDDLRIGLEELFLLDEALAYNGSVLNAPLSFGRAGIEESEAHLRDRGFIMKKRGDGYVPVSMESGNAPEFPPKAIFVHEALRRINESAKHWKGHHFTAYDLTVRRIPPFTGSRSRFEERPLWLEKEMLDLYGVEIRWNDARRRYEMVQ